MPKFHWISGITTILIGAVFIMSCQSTPPEYQMTLAGPMMKGAEYVGIETCEVCHPEQAKRFRLTSHFGTSVKEGEQHKGEACESCHGAGSLHVDAGGDPKKIVRYSADRCFVCHLNIRAKFQLQYHHPVPERWMKCTDCHSPHAEDVRAWSAVSTLRPGEKCFRCHKEFKVPFVFEHDPMRDGCQVCHDPHGSVSKKLLVAEPIVLCIRCHWEQSVNAPAAEMGRMSHAGFTIGRGAECIDCHRAPMGSNINRRFLR
jgi:predicted CXXCH cytochrome family protein